MIGGTRVRIKVLWQDQEYFFVRMQSATQPLLADRDSIRNAALLNREAAVALCRRLRELGFGANVVTTGGDVLFQDATAPPSEQRQSSERGNMTIAGLLFVLGGPPRNGYWLRFPGTEIESLWGATPEEVYQRLMDHPLADRLLPQAEKYVASPEPPVDVEALKRQLTFARHGRIRPGSME